MWICFGCCNYLLVVPNCSQEATSSITGDTVPHLITFSGVLEDSGGRPLTRMAGVTFSIYKDQEGGAPLWLETQNVRPDTLGHGENDTTSATGLFFYVVSTNSAPTKPVCEISTSADLLCSGSVSAAATLPN